jgi:hypothetical protein
MPDLNEMVPAPLARQELRLTQKQFDKAVATRRLAATRGQNQRWFVTRAAMERFKAAQAALEAGHLTAAELAGMDAPYDRLSETVTGILNGLRVAEVGFLSLEGDYAEAVNVGNLPWADAVRDTICTLRAAKLRWTGTRWELEAGDLAVQSNEVPAKAGA